MKDTGTTRHERGRLGGAGRLRPAARRSARALKAELERVRAGRGARVRLLEHPVHDRDPHRHVGDGQADPLQPAHPQHRPDLVGLRLGRQAPRAVQPVARRHDRRRWMPTRTRRTRARCGRGWNRGARAGISTLRGAFTPDAGIAEEVARKIKRELEKFGVADAAARRRRHRAARSCSPCSRRASTSSTGSRCSWRRVASRPPTRSDC